MHNVYRAMYIAAKLQIIFMLIHDCTTECKVSFQIGYLVQESLEITVGPHPIRNNILWTAFLSVPDSRKAECQLTVYTAVLRIYFCCPFIPFLRFPSDQQCQDY